MVSLAAFRKTEDLIIGTFYSQTFPGSKPGALVFSTWADEPDCGDELHFYGFLHR
jgi:hypothetical protein